MIRFLYFQLLEDGSWTPKKTVRDIDNTIKARAIFNPITNTLALANSQTPFIGRNFDLF